MLRTLPIETDRRGAVVVDSTAMEPEEVAKLIVMLANKQIG